MSFHRPIACLSLLIFLYALLDFTWAEEPLADSGVLPSNSISMSDRMDQMYGEHEPYRNFFFSLKDTVLNDNRSGLSEMIKYPLRIYFEYEERKGPWDGGATVITSKEVFMSNYDEIVTTFVIQALEAQQYEDLYVRVKGIGVDKGRIQFAMVCSGLRDKCGDGEVKIVYIDPRPPK